MLRSAEAKLLFNRFVHLYDGLFLFFVFNAAQGGQTSWRELGGLGRFEKFGWRWVWVRVRVSKVSLRRVLIAVRVRVRARALGGGSESREKDARL